MKTASKSLVVPATLLALFGVGGLAARALALPLPAWAVGLGLVVLGLRIAVIAAAIEDSGAPARPDAPGTEARGPALRAANG